jgi:hypothetical protein
MAGWGGGRRREEEGGRGGEGEGIVRRMGMAHLTFYKC